MGYLNFEFYFRGDLRKICNLQTNCLSVFDQFVKLALKGLTYLNCRRLVRRPTTVFPKKLNDFHLALTNVDIGYVPSEFNSVELHIGFA